MVSAGIGREILVWWDRDCSRKMPNAPHLLVVGAGNSCDTGPARLRQEAKRGARWLIQPIGDGGDRALHRPPPVLS